MSDKLSRDAMMPQSSNNRHAQCVEELLANQRLIHYPARGDLLCAAATAGLTLAPFSGSQGSSRRRRRLARLCGLLYIGVASKKRAETTASAPVGSATPHKQLMSAAMRCQTAAVNRHIDGVAIRPRCLADTPSAALRDAEKCRSAR